MNIRKLQTGISIIMLSLISTAAFAQFQGQITMKTYGENNGVPEVNELNLYATSDRIIVQGQESVSMMDGLNASGLLIRNDEKDFIVLMGENKALQFTKEELEGFFQMAGMISRGESSDADIDSNTNFRYTNREKKILGYDCSELLIESEDSDGSVSIWLTKGIDINWGMLTQPWNNAPENMRNTLTRLTQEFKSQNFPLLIEVTDKGEKSTVFEVTNVNRSSIAKAMVEVPAGVNLIGLQELIFSMMMGN